MLSASPHDVNWFAVVRGGPHCIFSCSPLFVYVLACLLTLYRILAAGLWLTPSVMVDLVSGLRLQGMVDLMTMHVAGLWGCCTLAEAAVVWCALPSSCINGCISQCVGVIMVCALMFVQCSCNAATLLCVGS